MSDTRTPYVHQTTNWFLFRGCKDGTAFFEKTGEGCLLTVPLADILRVLLPVDRHGNRMLALSTALLCVRDNQGYGVYWRLPHVGKPEPIVGKALGPSKRINLHGARVRGL
jgi:hypothetical protein